MDKRSRIKVLGKTRFLLWKIEDKIWKLLNKVFRVNFYKLDHKPKWLSMKIYLTIREMYENRVEKPYAKMTAKEIEEDLKSIKFRV